MSWPGHGDGLDRFAPLLVGDTDHRNFGNVGVVIEHVLDFGGIHVLCPGHDHVLEPIEEEQVAVLVAIGGIAGP